MAPVCMADGRLLFEVQLFFFRITNDISEGNRRRRAYHQPFHFKSCSSEVIQIIQMHCKYQMFLLNVPSSNLVCKSSLQHHLLTHSIPG